LLATIASIDTCKTRTKQDPSTMKEIITKMSGKKAVENFHTFARNMI